MKLPLAGEEVMGNHGEGIGAWWNSYGWVDVATCVRRARAARLDYMIVKQGHGAVFRAFREVEGLKVGAERYVYVSQPEREAAMLAEAVEQGADFVVVNAEEGDPGWWDSDTTGQAMGRLLESFRLLRPDTPIYASLDARGNRLQQPYQQRLLSDSAGVMPMIYPGSFRAHQPEGYVEQAFADVLDGKDFGDLPVIPTIQAYGWAYAERERRLGAAGILEERAALERRGLQNFNIYTIGHATDEEWQAATRREEMPVDWEKIELQSRVAILQALAQVQEAVGYLGVEVSKGDRQRATAATETLSAWVKNVGDTMELWHWKTGER